MAFQKNAFQADAFQHDMYFYADAEVIRVPWEQMSAAIRCERQELILPAEANTVEILAEAREATVESRRRS